MPSRSAPTALGVVRLDLGERTARGAGGGKGDTIPGAWPTGRRTGLERSNPAPSLALDDAAIGRFHRDGYVLVPGLFDREEAALLLATAQEDRRLAEHAMGWPDDDGGLSKITLWNDPGDDVYGMVARSARIVDSMERLLDGEVYHYHSKLMLKEPEIGGAWVWHQDYGYWYQNGCLYPLLASVFIALDPATRKNGCLQVLKGSHRIGRIEHQVIAGQLGADPERVEVAKQRHECVPMEMRPGDAAFFHCNLLHCSGQNAPPTPGGPSSAATTHGPTTPTSRVNTPAIRHSRRCRTR